MIDSFLEYGIQVTEITEEVHNKNLDQAECVRIISKSLTEGNFSFVFTINFFPTVSEVCNIYKIPYLSLIVDSPVIELFSASISNPCNKIFLFDGKLYQEFHTKNPDGIFHLPLASNVVKKQQAIASPVSTFTPEVSFVGSLYTEKCYYDNINFPDSYSKGYLDGLVDAQLQIYGAYFIEEVLNDSVIEMFKNHTTGLYKFPETYDKNYRALLAQQYIGSKITSKERILMLSRLSHAYQMDLYTASDTTAIPQVHNHGTVQTLTEMPLVFHNSKINLNITSRSIRQGIPLRVFDVLASGGFLISNYQEEIYQHFVPGEHMDLYSSEEELLEKVHYYMDHQSEAKEIARNGYEHICKYHTFTIRTGEMLSLAFGLKS